MLFAAVQRSLLAHRCVRRDAPFWTRLDNNGQTSILACDGYDAIDPLATLAVHCGNGFAAGFSPYQSTRLNRYDAVS
jgi:hypothetical protein